MVWIGACLLGPTGSGRLHLSDLLFPWPFVSSVPASIQTPPCSSDPSRRSSPNPFTLCFLGCFLHSFPNALTSSSLCSNVSQSTRPILRPSYLKLQPASPPHSRTAGKFLDKEMACWNGRNIGFGTKSNWSLRLSYWNWGGVPKYFLGFQCPEMLQAVPLGVVARWVGV